MNNKLTIHDLINYGFVNLIDIKENLYYLEFYFCLQITKNFIETRYYLGTIVCDENGHIYKSCLKSYCYNGNQHIGFSQIINNNDKINISDLFKTNDKGNMQFVVPSINETVNIQNGSRLWVGIIKNTMHVCKDILYIGNACSKEFFIEMQNRENIIEFFKEEQHKFNVLASSIITNGETIKNGLGCIAGAISSATDTYTYFYKKVNGVLAG